MRDYSRYRSIKVEKEDRVALVTLNRPDTLNAIVRDMHLELEDLLTDLDRDEDFNAIVLTGAGKAFSAGGDVKWMHALAKGTAPTFPMRECYRMVNNLLSLEKPLIAALNGHAIGLGATIALLCDAVFASESAKIGDPHVNIGMVAGDGGAVIWPLLVGVAKAKQYLMTGDLIDASEAERIGLITKVLPREEVLPAAMALAQRFANGPTNAINWTKMVINQFVKHQMNLLLPVSLASEYLSMKTQDHLEACEAFLEKRPPHYTGD